MERFSRQPTNSGQTPRPAAASAASDKSSLASQLTHPSLGSKLVVAITVVAAVAVMVALSLSIFGGNKSLVKSDKYQAVFLDNGQVYFGKLSSVNKDYVRLTDIYYLQVQQQVQPVQRNGNDSGNQNQPQAQISLAKLGNELHGPEDEMFILRSKIVFWENLKDDGQVVRAITDYKNGKRDNAQQNSGGNNNGDDGNQQNSGGNSQN